MTPFFSEFTSRFDDVHRMMRDLVQLERDARGGGRLGQRLEAAAIIRASTTIVAYNAIEGSFSNAVRAIRDRLRSENLLLFEATAYWQEEVLRHRLLGRLRSGISHDHLLTEVHKILTDARTSKVWTFDGNRMPYAGNIDHVYFFDFCNSLGTKLSAPKKARGGVDLERIRRDRNDLAHGVRTFSEVGSAYTLRDLSSRYARVQLFMRASLRTLQNYHDRRHFKAKPA